MEKERIKKVSEKVHKMDLTEACKRLDYIGLEMDLGMDYIELFEMHLLCKWIEVLSRQAF